MAGGIGEYPAEYNPKVHGPYNPARYYGKADTALKDVKLGEMTSWLTRRSYHPVNMTRAVSRGYWRWSQKWLLVKKPTAAPIVQAIMAMAAFYYIQTYPFLKYHRHTKYHW